MSAAPRIAVITSFHSGSFDEVTDGSRGQHLFDAVPVFVGREGEDARGRAHAANSAGGVAASAARHLDIQDGHLGLVNAGHDDGLFGVNSDPDQLPGPARPG